MLYNLCGFICGLLGKSFSLHHFLYCFLDNIPGQTQLVFIVTQKSALHMSSLYFDSNTHKNFSYIPLCQLFSQAGESCKITCTEKKKKETEALRRLTVWPWSNVIKLTHEPQVQQLQHFTVMWDAEYEHGVHRRKHIIQILV